RRTETGLTTTAPHDCAGSGPAPAATGPAGRLAAMCGIVGYVGSRVPSGHPLDVVLEGLRRLEYRGYDSAGVALVDSSGGLTTAKKAGKLANLVDELAEHPLPDATAAIGHTRWATHGGPTDLNAHPHVAG